MAQVGFLGLYENVFLNVMPRGQLAPRMSSFFICGVFQVEKLFSLATSGKLSMPCLEGSKASLAQLWGNISSNNLKKNSFAVFIFLLGL